MILLREGRILLSINLRVKSILPERVEPLIQLGRSGNTYMVCESKCGIQQLESQSFRDSEVCTILGNSIENKGFSTVLILRRESTIRFGHASAAHDP
jgi:hypothetical protein